MSRGPIESLSSVTVAQGGSESAGLRTLDSSRLRTPDFGLICLHPLFCKHFLSQLKGIHRGWHASVEGHMGQNLDNLLLRQTGVQAISDVGLQLGQALERGERSDCDCAPHLQFQPGPGPYPAKDHFIQHLLKVRRELCKRAARPAKALAAQLFADLYALLVVGFVGHNHASFIWVFIRLRDYSSGRYGGTRL